MKFLDQTGVSELITLVKKALKPLESMKSSITDVNGIVKSDGSGGFSAATAGTDYAAASHTHTKANITDFPSSMAPTAHKDTHKTGGSDALTPGDIGAAAVEHTHEAEDVNGLDTAMLLKNVSVALPSGAWYSVCYGEDRFVAVGDEKIAYSLNGFSWQLATSYPEYTRWALVCYGNGKFIAMPDSAAMAIYSTDGITWTSVTLPFSTTNKWYSLCYGGGKFVALTGVDQTVYSSDGITWTEGYMPNTSNWRAVCYGNGKFVAVNASNNVAYSTDGINWTMTNIADTGAYYFIAYGEFNGAGEFVALRSNSNIWAISTDGITWNTKVEDFGSNYQIMALTFGGGVFVAQIQYEVGVGFAIHSPEDTDWVTTTPIYFPSSSSGTNLFCYGNGLFISGYDSNGSCIFSADGINWNDGTRKEIVYPDSKVVTNEVKETLQLSASDITSGTLPIYFGGTGADTASGALSNLGAQAKAKTLTLSLTATGWSATSKTQTRAATGVTASNIVIVSPASASQEVYAAAGVRCTAQGASSLTFTCDTVPTEALSVNVVIL